MSWATDEWKDGLPGRALIKIQEMEKKLDRLCKEQKQRQFQMEQVEASHQKQIRKTEEEKSKYSDLKHENQSLSESCQRIERNREKLQHDIQNKDTHIACLEGKLSHAKQSLDAEINKAARMKTDLERAQMDYSATQTKFVKLGEENGKVEIEMLIGDIWLSVVSVKPPLIFPAKVLWKCVNSALFEIKCFMHGCD